MSGLEFFMVELVWAIRDFELYSKFAVTCFFTLKNVWFDSIACKTKNILQTAKNGNPILFMVKNGNAFAVYSPKDPANISNVSLFRIPTIFYGFHYHSLPYITITAFNSQNNLPLIYCSITVLSNVLSQFWCDQSVLLTAHDTWIHSWRSGTSESTLMPISGNLMIQAYWVQELF